MNWEALDWSILERLRAGFISGSAADGPYWQSPADLTHYDATYGERIGWKWDALLHELKQRAWAPSAPVTVVDWGCGSGIAGRRVVAALGLPHTTALQVWDHSALAREFAITRAREVFSDLAVSEFTDTGQPVDVLVLSHVLNELSPEQRTALLALVARARHVLWIEPGTHADSRALATIRDTVRETHQLIAPCTHRENCPLFQEANTRHWCHFFADAPPGIQNDPTWVRFSHRAGLDLRSQAYSCLVLTASDSVPQLSSLNSQLSTAPAATRLIGRPEVFKPYARFLACDATGLHALELSKRLAPALIKRLDRDPPVPLYTIAHDGRHVATIAPLILEKLDT
jgi:hypothetical protein